MRMVSVTYKHGIMLHKTTKVQCVVLLTGTAKTECLLLYYTLPSSITCREGARLTIACHVEVACDIEAEVNWFWNPTNTSNFTHLIVNSDPSGVHLGATLSSKAICSLNSETVLYHIYTLSMARLSHEITGFYWCQLHVVDSGTRTVVGDILPSNKCYVDVADGISECDYTDHSDSLMCAQSSRLTSIDSEKLPSISPMLTEMPASNLPSIQSALSELPATMMPSINLPLTEMPATTSNSPSPSSTPPINNRDNSLIELEATILEVIFLMAILICVATIVLLTGCLFRKYRRKREGKRTLCVGTRCVIISELCRLGSTAAVVVAAQTQSQKQSESDGAAATHEEPNPRYTPVITLTRTLSVPHLVSGWSEPYSSSSKSEDPLYTSPYQHLSMENLDYTSMYSKLHKYTEVTVGEATQPQKSTL